MISEFISSKGLVVLTQITTGHRCKHVYRVRDQIGRQLVLKFSEEDEGREEIRRNMQGYKKLTFQGLQHLIPNIISSSLNSEWGHILMEDCGTDFATMIRGSRIGLGTYDLFVTELLKVYRMSVGEGSDSNTHVDSQIHTAQSLYYESFQTRFGSPKLDGVVRGLRSYLPRRIKYFCFSSWDFMPGNIFIGDDGIKFIDPTECITGVPIIDLACLGGALGDVHHQADAQLWRKGLKSLSVGPIAQLLDLNEKEARQIYLLGRLVQTLLSLRGVIHQKSGNHGIFVTRVKRYISQLFFL